MAVTPGFGIIATAFLTESELSLKTSTSVNVVLFATIGTITLPNCHLKLRSWSSEFSPMAYTCNPTLLLIKILLFHFVLSQHVISVFANFPLRGRNGIREYVLCPRDAYQAYTCASYYSFYLGVSLLPVTPHLLDAISRALNGQYHRKSESVIMAILVRKAFHILPSRSTGECSGFVSRWKR